MIIAVDFDGSLVTHAFPKIGRDIGAFPWLKKWVEAGARLILWTMRSDNREDDPKYATVLTDAVEHCRNRGVEFWGVNVNPEQHTWTLSCKAYANLYIDDAAFGTPLVHSDGERPYVDWEVVGPAVLALLTRENAEIAK